MASSCSGSMSPTEAAGSSSTASNESESRPRPIVSLLEKLRVPSASELGRKRKIDTNPAPPKGKKRSTQNLRNQNRCDHLSV